MTSRGTLGDLLAKAGVKPSAPEAAPQARPDAARAPSPEPGAPDLGRCGKLVLRRERKGRGGKTATVLAGLDPALRDPVARALKRALGCGATVEGDTVLLQGDLAPRAQQWLAAHGARRIVLGT